MNPYTSNPDDFPSADRYADLPFYGRYCPKPHDFRVDPQHINSCSSESLRYWSSVLDQCDESTILYPADEGGRDVFALGSVIVKSSHLHKGRLAEIDYAYADANEIKSIALARAVLKDVNVLDIYFAAKVLSWDRVSG
ncbi:hypothetical protein F5B20DRAFT_518463 [Whalleya microplaca]|nr:hypothetical protein F5B20DRAFT_518463 [Whalleya microplaca]